MTSSTQPTNGRTGYLALHLPKNTSADRVPGLLHELVVDALVGSGESLSRVEIVTSERYPLKPMKRWFVEYETGPPSAPVT